MNLRFANVLIIVFNSITPLTRTPLRNHVRRNTEMKVQNMKKGARSYQIEMGDGKDVRCIEAGKILVEHWDSCDNTAKISGTDAVSKFGRLLINHSQNKN